MGYAVIRQVRIRPNTCRVHPSFRSMTRVCAMQTNLINEDDRDYCDGWVEMNNLTMNLPSCQKEVWLNQKCVFLSPLLLYQH